MDVDADSKGDAIESDLIEPDQIDVVETAVVKLNSDLLIVTEAKELELETVVKTDECEKL